MSPTDEASDRSVQAEIALVQEAFRGGNIALAEDRLNKLSHKYPNRPDVLMAKGMVFLGKGDQERALDFFSAVLEIDPNAGETLAWAAYVCLNIRRASDAEKYARKLTEIAPSNPRGFYLLANALRSQDKVEEAIKAIDRSLALNPDDVESLLTKGRLLQTWRLPALAEEFYRKSMKIRPTLGAAMELAQIAVRDSRPEGAIEVLAQVEPYLPVAERPHASIAEALTLQRKYDEAEKRWALASKYSVTPGVAQRVRAVAEIASGRFGIAEEILFDLIKKGDDPATSFSILTTARKITKDDLPLVERMVALAMRPDLTPTQRINISYGLGKSFDDIKDYERAISHYDEANRACLDVYRDRRGFSRDETRAFTDFLIEISTPERMQRLVPLGLESSLPLFVVGMMRSGTTLTESVLSGHSAVQSGGEQAFWTERVIEFVYREGAGLRYDHQMVLRFAEEYLRVVQPKQPGTRYVVDKNPANFDLAGVLHTALPNAKIVHLKRHPVDNLLSLWMTPVSGRVAYASDRSNLVFAYREYLRLWKHWQDVLPSDRFSTFRYEDLTSEPEETIKAMLDFLELEPEEACFAPEKNDRSVLTPSVFQVRQPIHKGSQKRWKNYEPWLGAFAELLEDGE